MSILSLVIANGKHNLIFFKTFLFRGEFFTRKWDFTLKESEIFDGLFEMIFVSGVYS
jgi:hypothetical protein|tara:strand:+ start:390 stop:560 length:171 start_codon:yes stop_codon:yes gene_type:complete